MTFRYLSPWRDRSLGHRREPLQSLQQVVDSLFDDVIHGFDLTPFEVFERVHGSYLPRVDVIDGEKEICVTAELPGMTEKDIELTLDGGTLTIKGEKKQESEKKEKNYYRMERAYGSFQREIPLPADVIDIEHPEAVYKEGVLTIRLPKKEEARKGTKKIPIKS